MMDYSWLITTPIALNLAISTIHGMTIRIIVRYIQSAIQKCLSIIINGDRRLHILLLLVHVVLIFYVVAVILSLFLTLLILIY